MAKYEYSKKISVYRSCGKINESISMALDAIEKYPEENIFEKILGDLYLQNHNYEAAGNAYLEFLKKIGDNLQYVRHFAQFIQRYSKLVPDLKRYMIQVEEYLDHEAVNEKVVMFVCEVVSQYVEEPAIHLFHDDRNFRRAVKYIREIEKSCRIYILYFKVLSIRHSWKNKRIDKYVVSSMEKKGRFKEALKLIVEVLKYDQDQVAVGTLFRVCRKLGDYTEAKRYIDAHPEIEEKEQFNILYELVFYYSKTNNERQRNISLERIEVCGRQSKPILRTLYNFYLQFGMLDKAVMVNTKITQMQPSQKYNEDRKQQEDDAAKAMLITIQELFAELEHSRKLISMSELLKGFSHELGQPITNIRYNVQLFQMKIERRMYTEKELNDLLENILSQTYRIKKLLTRFSPITSGKDHMADFHVVNEIKEVFQEFSSRLSKEHITWSIKADTEFYLSGDNVKFDQIFYNLIGNSIYAIKEKGGDGCILVRIWEKEKEFIITFEDNGIGIEPEYRGKVFEPFFTTKECSSDEDGGGEGLGLYIVWNIVRMFDGNIIVDKEYRNGARFIIKIKKGVG